MLGIGGLSAGFGDFDLVAGIDPVTIDEMGGAGGKFDERIGLGDQFAGKRIGFPGYFGPDFLVAVARGDGVGGFGYDLGAGIQAWVGGFWIESLLGVGGGRQEA